MPQQFNIIAKIQLQAGNVKPAVSDIVRQISGVKANINASVNPASVRGVANMATNVQNLQQSLNAVKTSANSVNQAFARTGGGSTPGLRQFNSQLDQTQKAINNVGKAASEASNSAFKFGQQAAVSGRQFLAFSVGAVSVVRFASAVKDAVSQAIEFQHNMVRLGQLGASSNAEIKEFASTISALSTGLGVSSAKLADVSIYLKGAGLSVQETKDALQALAKTSLAPTFGDIRQTTEGLISVRAQFNLTSKDYESVLGSINTVAKDFAAESEDIIEAIRRSGAAFKAAAGDTQPATQSLNEFIALFTSVRSTTRESADSIATSFRTIFARLQSNEVVKNLKDMGINLRFTKEEAAAAGQNIEGQFVGGFKAIQRVSQALKGVPTSDPRFSAIVNQIGGVRQVSKVIPLLQQSAVAQKAYTSALVGTTSLTRDSEKANEAFAVRIDKVRESFLELIREVSNSKFLTGMADTLLLVAKAAITVAKSLQPLIPLISTIATIKIGTKLSSVAKGFGFQLGNPKAKYATGGVVGGGNGASHSDSVNMNVAEGSFVIRAPIARKMPGDVVKQLISEDRSGGQKMIPVRVMPGEIIVPPRKAKNFAGTLQEINKGYANGGSVGRRQYTSRVTQLLGDRSKAQHVNAGFTRMLRSDHADNIAGHVPNGSEFIGSGTDAVAYRTPDGDVVRIGGVGWNKERRNAFLENGRPQDSMTVQPKESQQYGQYTVEKMPFVADLNRWFPSRGDKKNRILSAFTNRLLSKGKIPTDVTASNIGIKDNKVVAIDADTYREPKDKNELEHYLGVYKASDSLKSQSFKSAGYSKGGFVGKAKELAEHIKKNPVSQVISKELDASSVFRAYMNSDLGYAAPTSQLAALAIGESLFRHGKNIANGKGFSNGGTVRPFLAQGHSHPLPDDPETAEYFFRSGKNLIPHHLADNEEAIKRRKSITSLFDPSQTNRLIIEEAVKQFAPNDNLHSPYGAFSPLDPREREGRSKSVLETIKFEKSRGLKERKTRRNRKEISDDGGYGEYEIGVNHENEVDQRDEYQNSKQEEVRVRALISQMQAKGYNPAQMVKGLKAEGYGKYAEAFVKVQNLNKEADKEKAKVPYITASDDFIDSPAVRGFASKYEPKLLSNFDQSDNYRNKNSFFSNLATSARRSIEDGKYSFVAEDKRNGDEGYHTDRYNTINDILKTHGRQLGPIDLAGNESSASVIPYEPEQPRPETVSPPKRPSVSLPSSQLRGANQGGVSQSAASQYAYPRPRPGFTVPQPKPEATVQTPQFALPPDIQSSFNTAGFGGIDYSKAASSFDVVDQVVKDDGNPIKNAKGLFNRGSKRVQISSSLKGDRRSQIAAHELFHGLDQAEGTREAGKRGIDPSKLSRLASTIPGHAFNKFAIQGSGLLSEDEKNAYRSQLGYNDQDIISEGFARGAEHVFGYNQAVASGKPIPEIYNTPQSKAVIGGFDDVKAHAQKFYGDGSQIQPKSAFVSPTVEADINPVQAGSKPKKKVKPKPKADADAQVQVQTQSKPETKSDCCERTIKVLEQILVAIKQGGPQTSSANNLGKARSKSKADQYTNFRVPDTGDQDIFPAYDSDSVYGVQKRKKNSAKSLAAFEDIREYKADYRTPGDYEFDMPNSGPRYSMYSEPKDVKTKTGKKKSVKNSYVPPLGANRRYYVGNNEDFADNLYREAVDKTYLARKGTPYAKQYGIYQPGDAYQTEEEARLSKLPKRNTNVKRSVKDVILGRSKAKFYDDHVEGFSADRKFAFDTQVREQHGQDALDRLRTGDAKFIGGRKGGIASVRNINTPDEQLIANNAAEQKAKDFFDISKSPILNKVTKIGSKKGLGELLGGEERGQFGAGFSSRGKIGLGIGTAVSQFAPQITESYFGNAESPGVFGVEGVRAGKSIGGAISGAGAGAAAGSFFGPLGSVAGAAVGGLQGFVSSLKEVNQEIAQLQIAKNLSAMDKSIDEFLNGTLKSSEAVSLISANFGDLDKQESSLNSRNTRFADNVPERFLNSIIGTGGTVGSAERVAARKKFVQENIEPRVGQLRSFNDKLASETKVSRSLIDSDGLSSEQKAEQRRKRIEAFDARGGGDVARKIVEATPGLTFEKYYKEVDRQIVESNRARTALNSMTKALVQQELEFQKFNRIGAAIDSVVNSMTHLQSGLDATEAAFNGALQPIQALSYAGATENKGGLDDQGHANAVDYITSTLKTGVKSGPVSDLIDNFGKTATQTNTLRSILPSVISDANAGGATQGEGLVNKINAGVSSFGKKSGDPDEEGLISGPIKERLSNLLSGFDPVELAQQAGDNVQKLVDELMDKGFANVNDTLNKAATELAENANKFNSGLIKYQEMVNRSGEARDKIVSNRSRASGSALKLQAALTGRTDQSEASVATQLAPIQARQERLTGLSGAEANNAGLVGSRLSGVRGRISELVSQNEKGPLSNGASQELAALQGSASRLDQALRDLADPVEKNAILQDKLNKIEESRSSKLSYTEKLITADPRQRVEMARNANYSDAAYNQGNFSGFNAKQIQGALEHLESLGEAELPGYGGERASSVKNRLLANSANIALPGFTDNEDRQRVGVLSRINANDNNAVTAQGEVAKDLEGLQTEFFGKLEQMQANFFNELGLKLAEAANKDVQAAVSSNKGEMNKLNNARKAQSFFKDDGVNLSVEKGKELAVNGIKGVADLAQRKSNLPELINKTVKDVDGGTGDISKFLDAGFDVASPLMSGNAEQRGVRDSAQNNLKLELQKRIGLTGDQSQKAIDQLNDNLSRFKVPEGKLGKGVANKELSSILNGNVKSEVTTDLEQQYEAGAGEISKKSFGDKTAKRDVVNKLVSKINTQPVEYEKSLSAVDNEGYSSDAEIAVRANSIGREKERLATEAPKAQAAVMAAREEYSTRAAEIKARPVITPSENSLPNLPIPTSNNSLRVTVPPSVPSNNLSTSEDGQLPNVVNKPRGINYYNSLAYTNSFGSLNPRKISINKLNQAAYRGMGGILPTKGFVPKKLIKKNLETSVGAEENSDVKPYNPQNRLYNARKGIQPPTMTIGASVYDATTGAMISRQGIPQKGMPQSPNQIAKLRKEAGYVAPVNSTKNTVSNQVTPPSPLDKNATQEQKTQHAQELATYLQSKGRNSAARDTLKRAGLPNSVLAKAVTPSEQQKGRQGKNGQLAQQSQDKGVLKEGATKNVDPAAEFNKGIQSLGGIIGDFNKTIDNFGTTISGVAAVFKDLKIPEKIVVETNGRTEVIFNGAQILSTIQGQFREYVDNQIITQLKEKLPAIIKDLPING